MQKPTSALILDIIKFVMSDPQINQKLSARDHHPQTAGREIACQFFKAHPTDATKTAYKVSFIYSVKNSNLEQKDDVAVLVEVTAGNPPAFRIVNVSYY